MSGSRILRSAWLAPASAKRASSLIKKPYSVASLSRILRKAMADKAPLTR